MASWTTHGARKMKPTRHAAAHQPMMQSTDHAGGAFVARGNLGTGATPRKTPLGFSKMRLSYLQSRVIVSARATNHGTSLSPFLLQGIGSENCWIYRCYGGKTNAQLQAIPVTTDGLGSGSCAMSKPRVVGLHLLRHRVSTLRYVAHFDTLTCRPGREKAA